jgi:hypothetical protein
MAIIVPISTASVLTLVSSSQYLTDSATAAATRDDLTAYLAALTAANKADLRTAISNILPIVNARIDAISQELKSTGFILSDTMVYAQGFSAEVSALNFVTVNSLLTKSMSGTAAAGKAIFQTDNFELMKQYQYKKSLADFYQRYSGHLQDRRERLSNDLETLTTVHDNLAMIWDLTK